MGWKPADVAVTTGEIVEVVSIVIVSVLVSVTVLEILSANAIANASKKAWRTHPVVVVRTGGGVMIFVGVTVRFF
jgi:hypothetical protein